MKAAMNELVLPASPRARVVAFIEAYRAAPDDADIEIRVGTVDNQPAVVLSIGAAKHGMTAVEARTLADIFEDTMRRFHGHRGADDFSNIIMGLRYGATEAERRFPVSPSEEAGE